MTRQFKLVDETKRYAHANAGRTLRDPEPVPTHPLVPLSITVPDGTGGEVTEVRPGMDRMGRPCNRHCMRMVARAHRTPASLHACMCMHACWLNLYRCAVYKF